MRNTPWLPLAAAVVACGGSGHPPSATPSPSPTTAEPVATASAEPTPAPEPTPPTPDPSEDTQRAKDAAKWVKALASGEAASRGVSATVSLAEEQFGLPAPLRKGMEAFGSSRIDPSQVTRIIAAALEEGAPEMVQKLCGKPPSLLFKEIAGMPKGKWAKHTIDLCKLGGMIDVSGVADDSFVMPLLSVVVQKLFEAEGGHSKAEFELAKWIASARRPMPE